MRYGILWTDGNRQSLCEMDGGICYVNFATEQEAWREATELTATAIKQQYSSRYIAIPLPRGTRYFDGEKEQVA
jgi:hypothetical protein